MIGLKRRYHKDSSMVSRKIEEETMIIPIGKSTENLRKIYNLDNAVAVRIWDLIDGKRTVAEIKGAILSEFNVEPKKAEKDIMQFLADLEKIGAIKR